MVSLNLQPLYPLEKTPVTFEYEAVRDTETFWTFGEEKHFLTLPRFESWFVEIVTYSLYRVNCPDFQLLNKKFYNICSSANIICLLNKSEIGETCSTNGNYDK